MQLLAVLLITAFVLLVFLIIRAWVLWYWRVNDTINLLTEIRDLLRAQRGTPLPPEAETSLAPPVKASDFVGF